MHSDVLLFAEAILKEAAVTGFALWLFAMAVVEIGSRYRRKKALAAELAEVKEFPVRLKESA